MALRNGQGQRKKYLTLELSSASNLVEDMCAIVSEFQSAKIGVDITTNIFPPLRGGSVLLRRAGGKPGKPANPAGSYPYTPPE
jgi:hypothetical protein